MRTGGAFFILTIVLGGCGPSQFALVSPTTNPSIITSDQPVEYESGPLQFHFLAASHRLVIEIHNPTSDTIQFLEGSASDPDGKIHSILGESIPPGQSIKEIFPPTNESEQSGPPSSYLPPAAGAADQPGYVAPQGYNAPESSTDQSNIFWNWNGPGDVRISFQFERNGTFFQNEFVFHRADK